MKRHASMNRRYRLVWSQVLNAWVAVAENAKGCGKTAGRKLMQAALSVLLVPGIVQAAPDGGQVVSGAGRISRSGATTTIQQSSQNLSLNWNSFNLAPSEIVNFQQPSASAIAVNRIFDTNGTQILGRIQANGQVYLINPNGILFGQGAQVNVGGLVASTLNVNDAALNGSTRPFSGDGSGRVINQGTITVAPGGYAALLGRHVSNEGVITAQQGTVALGAGSAATLTFNGSRLVQMQVDQSVLNSLAHNGGLIQADGGLVMMTAGARNALLASVVNNTGVIQARTVENRNGTIILLGGMQAGSTQVGGTLDASAPQGGDGGLIETSAAHVSIANDARITTAAPAGQAGTWLIDPLDFTIAASGGDITGTTLSSLLGSNSVVVSTTAGTNTATNLFSTTNGPGDIHVNDAVSWAANTLTLSADRNININANLNGSGSASLALHYGQGTVAAGNTGDYTLARNVQVNLPAGSHYSTKQGSDGVVTNYTVINSLGAQGSISAADLQGMTGNLAGNYALGSNIDAAVTSTWNSGAGFTPIALGTQFTGRFDGLGHTISNLTISNAALHVGLFSTTGTAADIRNVGLVGGTLIGSSSLGWLVGSNTGVVSHSYATGTVSGTSSIGGLVGDNIGGTIRDSHATGNLNGSSSAGGLVGNNATGTVSRSYATGTVDGTSSVGGLIGGNTTGAVSQSYATGNVNGSTSAGGLIGSNTTGPVTDSYATGNVGGTTSVGGLIGSNVSGSISNTYARGSVSGFGSVGGLLGSGAGTISNSYWDTTTSGTGVSAGGTGLTSAQMQQQGSFNTWDFADTWLIYNGITAPLLRTFMTPLTVTANNASRTYDAQAFSGGNGVSYSTPPDATLLGSVSYSGSSQGATNVGTFVITPGGLYSNQQGYAISYANGTLTTAPYAVSLSGSRSYDGTTTVQAGALTLGPLVGSQTLTLSGSGTVANKNVGSAKPLTVTGLTLGDGTGLASNYTFSGGTQTADITQAALTVSTSNVSKIYDGGLAAAGTAIVTSGTLYSGAGDTLSGGSFAYTDKNVGNGNKTVTVGGVTVGDGINTGNYNVSYVSNTTSTINPYAVSLSGSRVYDGTINVAATSLSLAPLVGSETLSLAGSGTLANKNVGTGKTVSLGTLALGDGSNGGLASNYTFAGGTQTTDITVRTLSVSANGINKVYDGTTTASVTLADNRVGGDVLTLGNTSASFSNKNVGLAKPVSVSGISVSGTDAANYSFNTTAAATADITARVLSVSANGINKVYDGTTTASVTLADNRVGGDVLTLGNTSASFSNKNVGAAKPVSVSGISVSGADAANYSFNTTAVATADITQAPLTLSTSNVSKTYDGGLTAAGTAVVTGGTLYSGDALTGGSFAYTDKNVGSGNKTVSVSGVTVGDGLNNGNYSVSYASNTTSSITPATLGIAGLSAITKVYDATRSATLNGTATVAPLGSDDVTLGGSATALFDTKNVGTAKPVAVTGYTLNGTDAGNYTLLQPSGLSANITPASLSITGLTANAKVYDTTRSATLSGTATVAPLGSDVVTLGGSVAALFDTKNVGTAKPVTVTGFSITGTDAGNYTLSQPSGLAADITPATLNIAGLSANTKIYDATRTATLSGTATVAPLASDVVTLGGSAAALFDTKNVGTAKPVTVTGFSITGTDAGNYTLLQPGGLTANIAPAPLGIAANSATRLYGDANPTFSASYTGFKGGETPAVLSGTLALSTTATVSSNVGNYAITPSGQSATNYTISYVNGNLGVTPAPLGIAANSTSKTYGDTVSFSGSEFSSTGLKNGETIASVSLASAGAAPTAGVAGSPYAITASAATGGTFNAGNYTISYVNGNLGVTPAPLGIAANSTSKTYGDTVSFTGSEFSSTGLKNGETIASVSLASAGAAPTAGVAGSPYAITANGATGGTFNAGNYTISYVNGNLGVTPAPLGIAANSTTRLYGDANPAFSASYTGFKNGETPTVLSGTLALSTPATASSSVGNYAITPSGLSSTNYSISYVNGNLGVTPAPLGIAANSATRLYGDANPAFSASYTGFKNGETPSTLSGTLALNTPALATSNVGSYTITPSGQSSTNYSISYINGTLGVTPAPLGIAANSSSKVYGDTVSFSGSEFSSTGLKNGETIASVSLASAGAAPTAGVAGSPYAITASGASGGTFTPGNYAISYVSGNLGVTPAPLGIAANSATRLYGDANPTFSASYTGFKGGETPAVLTGTLALSTPAAATSNVGNYAITPSGQSATNYSISYVNGNLGVTPAPLGIAANSTSKTYGDTVSFSGSEFTSTGLKNGESIASVSLASAGTAPTAGVAGSPYAITASAATGGTFNAGNYTISYVNGTLGVTAAPLGIAANSSSKVYGDTVSFSGTEFSSSGLKNGESIGSVSLASTGTAPTAGVAGSPYAITASAATGGTFNAGNYTISYVNGTLGVTPAPLGIAANSTSKTYGDTVSFSGSEFTSAGLKNGESIASVSLASAGAAPTAGVAGSPYAITASAATGGTFNAGNYTISYVNGTLGVTPAPLAIVANNRGKTYGDTVNFTGTEFSSTGLKNGETIASVNLASAGAAPTAGVAGSPYAITASAATGGSFNPGNYSVSYVDGALVVVQANLLAVAANAAVKTYDGLAFSGGNGVSYTGFQGGDTPASLSGTLAYGGTSQGAVNVGNYTIIPSGQSSPNYTIVYANGNLRVTPAPLGIAANSATRLYGDANPAFSASYTGFKNGETLAVLSGSLALSTPATASSSVGNYAITPSGLSSTNYSISYVNGNLGVTPAPLGIAANSATRLYGDANPAFSASYTGFKNGETPSTLSGTLALNTPALATSNVGSYTITPSGQSSTNYSISYINGTLGVTPAPLGIAANSATRLYGDANPAFSASYTGFKGGETPAVLSGTLALSTTATVSSNVGNYAITPAGQSATNYTISYVNGNLGVTPAPLGIAANSTSKTYGDTVSFSGSEFSSTGLKNGETIASVSLASAGTAPTAGVAGSPYAITASAATGGTFNVGNYTISYVNGTLGVTPAPLGIAANSATRLYGDANPAFSASYTGFKNGETPTVLSGSLALSTPATASSSVGNYAITPSGLSSTNYSISYVNGNLGVTPAPLGIAANSATRLYGDANPAFSASYTGFKNGETFTVLSGTLALSTPAVATSNVGNYAITPSGQSATNYSISYVNGNLGVTPAPLGIAANSSSKVYGDTVSFTGTEFSSTGLKNGETIASVSLASAGAAPTAGVAGSPYAITASGASGGTFTSGNYAISYVSGNLGVTPAGLLGVAANAAVKAYDGLPFSGGNGVTYSGFRPGDTSAALSGTLAYGGTSQGAIDVGNYTIIPSGQSSPNYTIVYVNGNLRVIPVPLGIAANSATRLYGDANPTFSASYTGFKGGETPSVLSGTLALSTPAVATSNVGNYAITPSGLSSTNYSISYVNGNLGVTPAPLGIAANSTSKTYGDTVSFTGTEFSSTGLKNGETIASVSLASAGAAPTAGVAGGPYAITASAATGGTFNAGNYTISYVNGNLGVTAAPLIVTADAKSKVYGTADPAWTFASTGLVNGDTGASVFSGALARAGGENVAGGPYAITSGSLATNGNYTVSSFTDGTFTITPATLIYTATPAIFLVGQTPSGLSGSLSGFAAGDTQASATAGTLVWSSTADSRSAAGVYPIIGSGLIAANYTFSQAPSNATALTLTPPALVVNTPAVLQPLLDAVLEERGAPRTHNRFREPTRQIDVVALMKENPPTGAGTTSCNASGEGSDSALNTLDTGSDTSGVFVGTMLLVRVEHGGVRMPANVINTKCDTSP